MGNAPGIEIPPDKVPKVQPAPEGMKGKDLHKWEKSEKKRVDKETKTMLWKLQKDANQEKRRIHTEKRDDKRRERDDKRVEYREKERDKQLAKQGYHDKIGGWQTFQYSSHLYARMVQLHVECKILNRRISGIKGVMGMNIYELFESEDMSAAEEIFEKCKKNIESLERSLKIREEELDQLRKTGECGSVVKPKLMEMLPEGSA